MTHAQSKPAPLAACPRCGKQAPFTADNPWRPFCSERCKLIDLGNWAAENYRVPLPPEPPGGDAPGSDENAGG